jgi:transcriptional regulator with XRE-family HTH domain
MPNSDTTIDLKRLGENIRFLRMGKSWTLSDLARESGISKAYISDLENGSAGKPNIQYVYSIACALETTLDLLLHGTVNENVQKSSNATLDVDLPPGLAELKDELNLTESDVERLATIHFRGKRPRDKEGWRYLIKTLNMLGQHHRDKN